MEQHLFQPISTEERIPASVSEKVAKKGKRNFALWLGGGLILILAAFALLGPLFVPYDIQSQDLLVSNHSGSSKHLFGTDPLGRDIWVRTWHGAQVSLLIALLAVIFDVCIGVLFGGISGYFGGRVDDYLQRVIELLYGIPNLVVIILMLMWFEPGILPIALALSITGWIPMARIVRAEMIKLRSQEFVMAARALGASHWRLLFKHLLPNISGPMIVVVTFSVPSAIFFEAFLSFIGLGMSPPAASLGVLINDGYPYLQIYPYQLFWPALVLCLLMLGFNLLGNGLQDRFDPKLRR